MVLRPICLHFFCSSAIVNSCAKRERAANVISGCLVHSPTHCALIQVTVSQRHNSKRLTIDEGNRKGLYTLCTAAYTRKGIGCNLCVVRTEQITSVLVWTYT